MEKVIINGKFISQKLTGVQRLACEISIRLPFPAIHPPIREYSCHIDNSMEFGFLKGNLWEQFHLPQFALLKGKPILLNLGNTAPLLYHKNIITIHDLAWLRYPQYFSKNFVRFYSFLVPKIARRALHIFTVSNFSKREIMELLNIDQDKITVVYNGVSDKFKPMGIEKENLILTVATLQPYKNMENLIKGFLLAKERNLIPGNYKLTLAGGFNRKVFSTLGDFKKLINGRDDIILTGYLNEKELIGLYNRARVFVFVSLYEGFGLPPLEAMACGTPVILSNRASLPEVGGDAALYVDPLSIEDIAEKIALLVNDLSLWEELRRKGMERARKFKWEDSAGRIMEVLRNFV